MAIFEFKGKLTKLGIFSLNKVWKITNKNKFLMKYKMITVYGFHIDFQFHGQMSLPRDLQMLMSSSWLWIGLTSWLWDFWSRFLFPGNVYAYTHVCQHVLLSYDQFIFQKTTLAPNLQLHKKPSFSTSIAFDGWIF